MIGFLVAGGEPSENNHVVRRDLEEAAAFEANPISVLFDFQIQSFPMDSFFEVEFFNKVCSLTAIEPCNNVQELIFKGQSGMEVPPRVQISHLRPLVCSNVVHFTLVHAFRGQAASDRKNLTFLLFY